MGNGSSKGVSWISTKSWTEKSDPDGCEIVEYRNWVLSALPLLRRVSAGLSRNFGLTDKRSDCLKNIESSALLLEKHLNKIKSADDIQRFDDDIDQLACCLEKIFSALLVADEPDQEKESPFPRLQAMYRASKQEDFEVDPPGVPYLSHLDHLDTWRTLQDKLESLTDKLEPNHYGDNFDDMEDSKLPETWKPPDEGVCKFFDRAFGAMLCKCGDHPMRTLTLRIGTYREGLRKPRPKSLCVLLPWEGKAGKWLEVLVHDKTPGSLGASEGSEHSTANICNHLKALTDPDFRLDLNLQQNDLSLSIRSPQLRAFDAQCLEKQIDLKSLLSLRERKWRTETKWALAILLAYALLYMYGGSNFKGVWRRENVLFFHDGRHIPLRPFLCTQVSSACRHGDPITPSRHHKHPDIVMLGVMLLEIYLGQRLESFLGMEEDIRDDNDFYLKAWKAYRRPESSRIPGRYRKVIRSCIHAGTFHQLDGADPRMRSEFFRRIVKPLDEDIFAFEGLDFYDLDKDIATKCDLAGGLTLSSLLSAEVSCLNQCTPENQEVILSAIRDKVAVPRAFPSSEHQPAHGGHTRALKTPGLPEPSISGEEVNPVTKPQRQLGWMNKSSPSEAHSSSASPFPVLNPRDGNEMDRESHGAALFDAKTVADGRNEIAEWKEWLDEFTKFRCQILPQRIDPGNEERVRITIIDTGIDDSHPFIRSTGWSSYDVNAKNFLFCDFAERKGRDRHDPIDEDGHGTFIAGLLLQAAPDIELSVARIGLTRESIKRDPSIDAKVIKAIEHAMDSWNTDIISMSFGKMDPSDGLCVAVEKALTAKKILLAATGNSGNRKPISFPAKRKRVFKIFATDMLGTLTSFSSPPHNDDHSYCFAVPGHKVVSIWPSNLLSRAEQDGLDVFCWDSKTAQPRSVCEHAGAPCDLRTVMSGTSFATPIAAALIALIYQFYNVNKESETFACIGTMSEERFKTPDAVQVILGEMSRSDKTHPYNFLVPGWGREGRMRFKSVPGASAGSQVANVYGETAIQFFARQLYGILQRAGI